ncbi:leucine-rich repeat protein (LRRP) [Trypanosoma brucei equiperdum]|uniref:Leucine-rich repeat protein (LRRP) n=1 Tax=Trypanosoma brucei equiperdum TaxID=630700 RepID=A0A3L6KSW5_9TRYP|nr:leucine-rich repeat protein (LRRP) [Trypanosoma brucei equiperdum]
MKVDSLLSPRSASSTENDPCGSVESVANDVASASDVVVAYPQPGRRWSRIIAGPELVGMSLKENQIKDGKALCIYGHCFDDGIIDYITNEVLPEARVLTKVEIAETKFSSAGMKILLRALWTNSLCEQMEELLLHDVHLHFEETLQLKEVIMKNRKCLRRLVLQRCHMDDSAAEPIVQAISHCEQLREVNFLDNNIVHALAIPTEREDIFPPTLQIFDISGNRIEPKHFTGLGNALRRCMANLHEVYLARCCVTESGLKTLLCGGLYNSQVLSVLNVSAGRLLHTAGKVLSSVISECPNLQRVYMQDNLLDVEGAAQIALVIPYAKKLTVLGMGRCHLGGRGARYIAEAVKQSASLRELDLSGNGVTDEDVHRICACNDDASFRLSYLDLSDNPLTEDCRCSLETLLEHQKDNSCIVVVRGTGLAVVSSYMEYHNKPTPG